MIDVIFFSLEKAHFNECMHVPCAHPAIHSCALAYLEVRKQLGEQFLSFHPVNPEHQAKCFEASTLF